MGTRALRLATLLLVTAASCSSDSAGPSTGFVQIASVTASPATATCGTQAASTYIVVFQIQVVNTTAEDATVAKVATHGVVIAGTRPEDIGITGHVFASIPFTPTPAVLVARRGELTLRATMTVPCGQHPGVITRDISTTVVVSTATGQFNSTPMTVRVEWRPL